jgi:hypothetical protein
MPEKWQRGFILGGNHVNQFSMAQAYYALPPPPPAVVPPHTTAVAQALTHQAGQYH